MAFFLPTDKPKPKPRAWTYPPDDRLACERAYLDAQARYLKGEATKDERDIAAEEFAEAEDRSLEFFEEWLADISSEDDLRDLLDGYQKSFVRSKERADKINSPNLATVVGYTKEPSPEVLLPDPHSSNVDLPKRLVAFEANLSESKMFRQRYGLSLGFTNLQDAPYVKDVEAFYGKSRHIIHLEDQFRAASGVRNVISLKSFLNLYARCAAAGSLRNHMLEEIADNGIMTPRGKALEQELLSEEKTLFSDYVDFLIDIQELNKKTDSVVDKALSAILLSKTSSELMCPHLSPYAPRSTYAKLNIFDLTEKGWEIYEASIKYDSTPTYALWSCAFELEQAVLKDEGIGDVQIFSDSVTKSGNAFFPDILKEKQKRIERIKYLDGIEQMASAFAEEEVEKDSLDYVE